jgi:short-subunit dehydrogenase
VCRRTPAHSFGTGEVAMTTTLQDARIWVTGASSGIGAALARELVSRGARVAISARREDRLAEVSDGEMAVVPLDVTDHEAFQAAAEKVVAELGGIDVVVFNAGAWTQTDVRAWDVDAFRRMVEVNLLGTSSGLAAVLPGMLERGAGKIVIVTSVAGYRGIPGSEAYGATKAALINLAESLRADLAPTGVQVQWVSPGFVRTELTAVNSFRMPFLIEPEQAATTIADGIESDRPEIVFPLAMAASMKALQLIPHGLWTSIWKRQSLAERSKDRSWP